MARPGVMLYFDFRPAMERLSDRELGQMTRAILDYGEFHILPQWKSRPMCMLWDVLQPKLDADRLSYETKVAKRRKAAKCRWENANASDAEERETERETETERERETDSCFPEPAPATTTTFIPPTVSQVNGYCKKQGFPLFGEQFVAYYSGKGWMLGNTPMEDWKAVLYGWNMKEKERKHGTERPDQGALSKLGPIGNRI